MQYPNKQHVVNYWLKGSKLSLQIAKDVFERKYYDHALFCSHLALEKLLKAVVLKRKNQPAPRSHDLVYLAKIASIELPPETEQQLTEINSFNVEGRYPEEKLAFHKRASKQFSKRWIDTIADLHLWLTKQSKKK